MSTVPTNDEELRAEVRHRYAQAALQILKTEQPPASACCGPSCCTPGITVASTASASLATLSEAGRKEVEGKFVSAFIRAQKPLNQ